MAYALDFVAFLNKLALIRFWSSLVAMWALISSKCGSDGCCYIADGFTLSHIHFFNETIKYNVNQGLCKTVYNHLIGQDVGEFDFLQSHFITDRMMLDIDMLGLWVENWVVVQHYWSLIIIFQWDDNFSPLTSNFQVILIHVILNCVNACIVFRDLDESMFLIRLYEFQFCE